MPEKKPKEQPVENADPVTKVVPIPTEAEETPQEQPRERTSGGFGGFSQQNATPPMQKEQD